MPSLIRLLQHVLLAAAVSAMTGVTNCPALLPPMPAESALPSPFDPAGRNDDAERDGKQDKEQGNKQDDKQGDKQVEADPAIRLLRTLEVGARDLRSFTASVFYETREALLGQRVIEKGRLIYTAEPGTKKKALALLFDTTIEDNRSRKRLRHYIIKDGWLVEIDHENKQFVKRQIVRPDQDFDPLKLGEGPIPLPIGQPADEVLARFDVSLIDLPEEGPLRKLRGVVEVDGLLLVPKPGGSAARDFRRIELFYDRKTRLPVGVNVVEANGDRKTARLTDLVRNPVLDAATLALISIERPKGDWRVDIRPLEP